MASSCSFSKDYEPHEPPYVDIFETTSLNDEDKVSLLKSDWPDIHKYAFKLRWSGNKARKAQVSWFTTYPWLRHSKKENGHFSAPCSLFVGSEPRGKVLVKTPLINFSNAPRILRDHDAHHNHDGAKTAANNFLAIQSGESKSIESVLDTKYNEMVERNRSIVVRIIDAIVFCGEQNLPLRGHKDEELKGNFIALLHHQAKTDTLLKDHLKNGVNTSQKVGQGYDGAGNKSGKRKGVQARIQQLIHNAVYIHCRAHCLNLAIVHACNELFVKNMMGTVQTVAFAFNYSAKRLLKYQETLETDPQSIAAMGNKSKLTSLCETRWTARAKALDTFLCSYSTVVSALQFLADDGDAKAAAYRLSVSSFDFVVTLVATEHCIKSLVQLSGNLQDKTCDLLQAAQEAKMQKVMLL